jgi:hypothetical protein
MCLYHKTRVEIYIIGMSSPHKKLFELFEKLDEMCQWVMQCKREE